MFKKKRIFYKSVNKLGINMWNLAKSSIKTKMYYNIRISRKRIRKELKNQN